MRTRKNESDEGAAKKVAREVGPASGAHDNDVAADTATGPMSAGWAIDEDETAFHGGILTDKLSPTSVASVSALEEGGGGGKSRRAAAPDPPSVGIAAAAAEIRPGAVAIPGPGATDYGETRLSRYGTTSGGPPVLATSESSDGAFSNVEAGVITANAFLAEEPDDAVIVGEEPRYPSAAGRLEKEEEEFCCLLNTPCCKIRVSKCTGRRIAIATLLGILAAGAVVGIVVGLQGGSSGGVSYEGKSKHVCRVDKVGILGGPEDPNWKDHYDHFNGFSNQECMDECTKKSWCKGIEQGYSPNNDKFYCELWRTEIGFMQPSDNAITACYRKVLT